MENMTKEYTPILHYLTELRRRLLYCLSVIGILFCLLSLVSNTLYHWLALPLLHQLPKGGMMIATEVTATLFAPMKLTFFVAIFLSVPFLLYHFWAFVAPALYRRERRMIFPLLISSSILFYLGMSFAYFIVFPLMFNFLVAITPPGVTIFPDMSRYLEIACQMLLAFGAAFEVPIIIVLLIWTNMVELSSLAAKRPYVVVGVFILGMLLTPPDVVSQTLLAVPLWGLFEVGLLVAKISRQKMRELSST